MTPVVYQNRGGTESLWADQTVMLNFPNGPTAVRWYQFDVTGGTFPATPVQQQDWTNGNDGLWRFMPSIAVDQNGNTAIGYATSSSSHVPRHSLCRTSCQLTRQITSARGKLHVQRHRQPDRHQRPLGRL